MMMNWKTHFGLMGGILIVVFGISFLLTLSPKQTSGPVSTNGSSVNNSVVNESEGGGDQLVVPIFTLASIDGKTVNSSNFIGKPTMLKLGTTYCHVCMQEIPEMKQAYREIGDKVNIVFVLIGASSKQAQDYINKYDLDYPVYIDQGSTARLFNVLGTPTHAFLDSNGGISETKVGFMSASQITSRLSSLL